MRLDAAQRWTFVVPTSLGVTRSTCEFAQDELRFTSDDLMGGSQTLPWSSIRQGCTATMPELGGKGLPDLPNGAPSQLEWLLLARTEGGGQPFMRALPQGKDRDAIVAAVEARLGPAWVGTRLPIEQARQRLGIAEAGWSTMKVVGIVVAVLVLLTLLLVLLSLLMQPVITVPAGFVLGAWVCREGLGGLRDALAVANTPTSKAGSAALGLVELEGRAITSEPSTAAVTGRSSVWWDVTVSVWHEDGDRQVEWRQVAARHGGRVDLVEFQDDSMTLPVWLPGATLLVDQRTWDSSKDRLPERGLALLEELGLPWGGEQRITVTEECLEADKRLFVLGTLDERRNVREPSEASAVERGQQLVRSGEWRRALVDAVPAPMRVIVAVLIGLLDMVTQVGRGGERRPRDIVSSPPALAPEALLVWRGHAGRPFVVSDRPGRSALSALRRRSLWVFGLGGAVLCFTLYQFVELFLGQ
ncbi:MAG: hypothetical protein V4792_10980 [Pseudomonadota bacterium]